MPGFLPSAGFRPLYPVRNYCPSGSRLDNILFYSCIPVYLVRTNISTSIWNLSEIKINYLFGNRLIKYTWKRKIERFTHTRNYDIHNYSFQLKHSQLQPPPPPAFTELLRYYFLVMFSIIDNLRNYLTKINNTYPLSRLDENILVCDSTAVTLHLEHRLPWIIRFGPTGITQTFKWFSFELF